jgi:hypothetical protein
VPIEYQIDHTRRLVTARALGQLTDAEVFDYQRDVWSRPDVVGYNELVDMTEVETIALPSPDRVRDLADVSAAMDSAPSESKFAIVAPQNIAFGLGRMYEVYRGLNPRSTKRVGVFRTRAEALAFLGLIPLSEQYPDADRSKS